MERVREKETREILRGKQRESGRKGGGQKGREKETLRERTGMGEWEIQSVRLRVRLYMCACVCVVVAESGGRCEYSTRACKSWVDPYLPLPTIANVHACSLWQCEAVGARRGGRARRAAGGSVYINNT